MKNKIDILKRSSLFSDIGCSDLKKMLVCLSAYEKTYIRDQYVRTADEKQEDVGIVVSGSVNIVTEDYWGNRAIFANISEGEIFGEEQSCTDFNPGLLSVVSAEKTEIMFVNYKKLMTTCTTACIYHSQLIRNLIKILAGKNLMLTQKIEHMVKKTTREKLMSYFSQQAKDSGSGSFTIPFNRQELADYLSVDRSAMSAELSKLRKDGIIEFNKNSFTLIKKTTDDNGL
ncbi:MAG: Crp/Fnr family transcriptional regulator [Oscillospiraceae bacterium]|nr:Crp/Fnr family transcriptional regulator [Oscillospiraceae bacterium]